MDNLNECQANGCSSSGRLTNTNLVLPRKGGGIDIPPNRHSRRIYRQPQQQEEEMNPPNPPLAGADPAVAAQMWIMQQMADTMAD
ncbi:hypothetical protein ACJX0J_027563, partial [Zea mays]